MLSTSRVHAAIRSVMPPAVASRCRFGRERVVTLGGLPGLCRYLAAREITPESAVRKPADAVSPPLADRLTITR